MKPSSVRQKGQSGEREAAMLIGMWLNLKPGEVKRNLNQTREGGFDLAGLKNLAVEVKRQEVLALDKWWKQACNSCVGTQRVPVVMFKQNRRAWRYLFPAYFIAPRFYDTGIKPLSPDNCDWIEVPERVAIVLIRNIEGVSK